MHKAVGRTIRQMIFIYMNKLYIATLFYRKKRVYNILLCFSTTSLTIAKPMHCIVLYCIVIEEWCPRSPSYCIDIVLY